jgi:hypothetical protein
MNSGSLREAAKIYRNGYRVETTTRASSTKLMD